jgi:hypothetical protein
MWQKKGRLHIFIRNEVKVSGWNNCFFQVEKYAPLANVGKFIFAEEIIRRLFLSISLTWGLRTIQYLNVT